MGDITIESRLKALGIEAVKPGDKKENAQAAEGPKFNDVLKKAIAEVSGLEKEADKVVQELLDGKETNIHDAMIALQKADLSFKVLMEVRDKIISAYKEIMRLQV